MEESRIWTDHSRGDIEGFPADLGKRAGMAEWQVRQAEHSLKILYKEFLSGYAPDREGVIALMACLMHGNHNLPVAVLLSRENIHRDALPPVGMPC